MTESRRSRIGRAKPTRVVSPSYSRSDGQNAIDLCEIVGLELFEWQANVLDILLARDDTGHWAADTVGQSLSRQNGKTGGTIRPRIVYGTAIFGEWVIYTAHLQKTSTESFEEIAELFEVPELRDRVDRIKTAIGREEIRLKNGGRIKFLARTRAGGRGQHGDLLVFDEAQNLTDAQQASFLPAISASKNPQTIYTGTPPRPQEDGLSFRRIRSKALNGEPKERERMAWMEWGVDEIPSDKFARDLWYETNPSLGLLIPESAVANEARVMSDDDFARERLGWWSPDEAVEPPAIPLEEWRACEVEAAPSPARDERVACGVKFSADGSTYSVSVAARSKRAGYALVECVDRTGTARGVTGLAEWLYRRRGQIATVTIDGRSWTPTLVSRLDEMGFPKKAVHVARVGDVCDACAMLAAAVEERNVQHIKQPLLEESVAASPPRLVGRDGWAFGGDDPTPIESVALAFWGVMTSKRNPRRKLRIST